MASSVDFRVFPNKSVLEDLFFVRRDEFLRRYFADGTLSRGLFSLMHIPTDDASPFHRALPPVLSYFVGIGL
jgi:hypothetical protein